MRQAERLEGGPEEHSSPAWDGQPCGGAEGGGAQSREAGRRAVWLSGSEPHRSQVLQTETALSQGTAVCLRPHFSFKICDLRGLSSQAQTIRGKGLYFWWRTCCKRAWKGGRRGSLNSCESSGESVRGTASLLDAGSVPVGAPQRPPLGNTCWP